MITAVRVITTVTIIIAPTTVTAPIVDIITAIMAGIAIIAAVITGVTIRITERAFAFRSAITGANSAQFLVVSFQ